MSKTFTISTQPYYDQYNQCYLNILTLNSEPEGPLKQIVRRINFPKLSTFQRESPCNLIPKCGLVIQSLAGCNGKCSNLMTPNEIPDLMTFLLSNGYQIENQLTNMLNQSDVKQTNSRLCFIVTFYGGTQPSITYMR